LGLQGNELGGSIPHELFLMGTLEGVTLSENNIGGTVPMSIGQLTLLSTLWVVCVSPCVNATQPTHVLCAHFCASEHLELLDNVLTGSIPSTIGLLTNLGKNKDRV
jgi:hypothetical protein